MFGGRRTGSVLQPGITVHIPDVMPWHANRHTYTARSTQALSHQARCQERTHHMQGSKTARQVTKQRQTVVRTANRLAVHPGQSAALKMPASPPTFSNNGKLPRSTCAAPETGSLLFETRAPARQQQPDTVSKDALSNCC